MTKPKINPPLRTTDVIIEALAAICLIYMVTQLIIVYPGIDHQVPTHFGSSGKPDAWGSKTSLLLIPVVSIVIYAGLTVLNKYPYIFNYPVPITEENASKQYRDDLMRIAQESLSIPAFLFNPEDSKVVSGTALDINMFPLKTFINKMREKRVVQYNELFSVILKLMGIREPNLSETFLNFGVFANLGVQIMNAYSQMVLAGILSEKEAKAGLVDEGVIPDYIIDETITTVEEETEEGEQTNV